MPNAKDRCELFPLTSLLAEPISPAGVLPRYAPEAWRSSLSFRVCARKRGFVALSDGAERLGCAAMTCPRRAMGHPDTIDARRSLSLTKRCASLDQRLRVRFVKKFGYV